MRYYRDIAEQRREAWEAAKRGAVTVREVWQLQAFLDICERMDSYLKTEGRRRNEL